MYDFNRSENYDCNNCKHLACSEVRATIFSSKCDAKMRSSRYNVFVGDDGTERDDAKDFCRKDLAVKHLSEKEKCAAKADRYVNYVFDRCVMDAAPFNKSSKRKIKNISGIL